ncbi:MAG: sodium:solute symporter family protein [Chlorobi bacterium]|nr:sodium:solute symporter family protein [Chlorobiota bacterium]
MFGLGLIDILVIVSYFLVIIAIGFWSMSRIKDQEDYFLAGRRFGKFIQTFAAFGQGTSADTAIGVSTTTFSNGASGIWSSLLYLFSTPLYWLVMPWMRRLRLITLGDFFEERYGSKALAGVYAIIGTIGMMAILSVGFSAVTKTVAALTPKEISQFTVEEKAEYDMAKELDNLRAADYVTLNADQKERLAELNFIKPQKTFSQINQNILMWLIVFIVLAYAITGGLEAAFITDTIQGIFIIILSFLLIPFALSKISLIYNGNGMFDAFRIIHEQLPESTFEIFGSPSAIDFTWYYILALAVMGTLNVVIQPNSLVANGSAKNEYAARVGFVAGSFMKRFVTVLWGFFAIIAIVLYSGEISNPDYVWGYATLDLLGGLNIGLIGLMIASLLAAQMSTSDCLMITSSSLLTHNLYRPLFPNRSEKHYIFIGRITGGVVLIGAALIATQFDSILQILKFMWEVNVTVAASFWLGMKWRRANLKAAWASIGFTSILFFILPASISLFWSGLTLEESLLKTTNPAPVVREYTAKAPDVKARLHEISIWENLPIGEKESTTAPEQLEIGDRFEKTYILPQKSIFWTKGIKKLNNNQLAGSGMLNIELVFLDRIGFDLSKNSYAMNETIRIIIRTVVPFVVFLLVALYTKEESNDRIDRFFAKMKTKVADDPESDIKELELSYNNPERFDHMKVLPKSAWEFDKWDKEDIIGFSLSIVGVFVVIGLLIFLVSVGS